MLKRHNASMDSRKYKNCNKRVRKNIKEAKELWINDQCKEIERNLRVNISKKAFDMVRTLSRKLQPRMEALEDSDGKLLANIDDILARWKECCEEL